MTPYELELVAIANEQLVKQQEQIDALKSELDRAVELYTDKAIENEALIKKLYFKDYYEELPDTPVDLLRKAQEK